MTMNAGSGEYAVSVVISTYNRATDLRGALEAVMRQVTAIPYEILIVDNNSTDDTREIVERAVQTSPVPLTYLFEPRQGVSYGRNTGIMQARAPIIAMTDDDCRPAPDWLASIVREFERHPDIDCIGGRVAPRWPNRVPRWFTRLQVSPLAICEHGDQEFRVDAENAATCLLTANLACRRSVFDKAGLFSTDYPRGQDREIQLRMWRFGCRGLYAPSVVVEVPIPEERLTKPYFRNWFRRYGAVHARLELLDRIDRDGRLVEPPVNRRLFGTSPHVYREFAAAALRWAGSVMRRDEVETFFCENRVRYLGKYIATSYRRDRATRSTSHAAEVTRFLSNRFPTRSTESSSPQEQVALAPESQGDPSKSPHSPDTEAPRQIVGAKIG